MVDIFEEVESELRAERYKTLALKLLPWVLAGLFAGLLIAGGAWAVVSARERAAAEAATIYADGLEMVQQGDLEGAFVQFDKISARARSYKALSLMHQGAIRVTQNKNKEAAELFDKAAEVAPSGEAGLIIADAARLKSALALFDEASYADLEAKLKPLTADERPYRPLAREALAFALIKDGKLKEAREEFVVLSLMQGAPDGLKDRANGAVAMIDSGLAAQTGAVMKAVAALPPPAPPQQGLPAGLTPEMIQQMMQQQQQQGAPPAGAPQPSGTPK